MGRFFIKNKFFIVVIFTILGCSNKDDLFTMNSYIHDFYVSKAYYIDQEKKVEPIELLEVNFIQNEEKFNSDQDLIIRMKEDCKYIKEILTKTEVLDKN